MIMLIKTMDDVKPFDQFIQLQLKASIPELEAKLLTLVFLKMLNGEIHRRYVKLTNTVDEARILLDISRRF